VAAAGYDDYSFYEAGRLACPATDCTTFGPDRAGVVRSAKGGAAATQSGGAEESGAALLRMVAVKFRAHRAHTDRSIK